MADATVYILSPRIGTGIGNDAHRPQVADHYPIKWADITALPALRRNARHTVDALVIQATADQDVIDQIDADIRYAVIRRDGSIASGTTATKAETILKAKGLGQSRAAQLRSMVKGSAEIGVREIIAELRRTGGA